MAEQKRSQTVNGIAKDLHRDGMLWLGGAAIIDAEQSKGKAQMSNAVALMRAAMGKKREARAEN